MLAVTACHRPEPRARAIRLTGSKGACSGTQIRAASGVDYILTAGHCREITDDDTVMAERPGWPPIVRRIIQVSEKTDLMLVEGLPGFPGLPVATREPRPGDRLTALTHGHALDVYRDDGEFIQLKIILVPVRPIASQDDEAACRLPKYRIVDLLFMRVCVLRIEAMVSKMPGIVPGSSGGSVLNDLGELVGVAFAGDGTFAFIVRSKEIRQFIRGY
jgi:hypothetical protein